VFSLVFSLPRVVANTFSLALWTSLSATMSNIILFYLNNFISYKLSCVGWKTDDSVVDVTFSFFGESHQPLTLIDCPMPPLMTPINAAVTNFSLPFKVTETTVPDSQNQQIFVFNIF
jgi:hypothetical protein